MKMDDALLLREERAIYALRSLYGRYGYSQYRMSKFEEYDLYVRNKDFLISDHVITFTDKNGRLMALKPDVTLSIIKNGRDQAGVQKVCYNENVYRATGSEGSFREIMQVGLECLGEVDDYCVSEVLLLAAKSLRLLSPESVLNVSHLGVLSALLERANLSEEARERAMGFIAEKNPHELAALCRAEGADGACAEALGRLMALHGRPGEVLPALRGILSGLTDGATLDQLQRIVDAFRGTEAEDMLNLDFSVDCNMKYYNGIVFAGFIRGVPTAILSGGQYDKLMRKLGRKARAIGFAVYLDLLELLPEETGQYDVDTALIYDASSEPAAVRSALDDLLREGGKVAAFTALPPGLRVRRVLRFSEGEVKREDA